MENKQAKKICVICAMLVFCIVTGRIIYVNCAYPYAGIIHKEQKDELSYMGSKYRITGSKLYSKEKWLEYIGANNINEEAKEHKVFYSGNDDFENIKDYDYMVGYNPDEVYKVLVLEISFDNDKDMKLKESVAGSFSVVKNINSAPQFYDDYYSYELDKLTSSNMSNEAGETSTAIGVYIINDDVEKLYLGSIDLGNNTLVELEPEYIN